MTAIVFAHVPKSAGTSIANAFAGLFDSRLIHAHFESGVPKSVGDYGLIVSHAFFEDIEKISGEKVLVTCMRHPVTRLTSIYNFFNSITDQRTAAIANPQLFETRKLSFEDFLQSDSPNLVSLVDNGTTRYFSNAGEKVTDEDVEVACRNLDKLSYIIMYEKIDEDLRMFFSKIECAHRYDLKQMNTTTENYISEPNNYNAVEPVDFSELSPAGNEALVEATRFDLRLYNYALLLSKKFKAQAIEDLNRIPIRRTRLARGETIVPSSAAGFTALLASGWASGDSVQWTSAKKAKLKFQIFGGASTAVTLRLQISGCMLENSDYILCRLTADRSNSKMILFVNNRAVISVNRLLEQNIDVICGPSGPSEIDLELLPDANPDAVHEVEFTTYGTSSPEFLNYNNDKRSLSIQLHSLKIL